MLLIQSFKFLLNDLELLRYVLDEVLKSLILTTKKHVSIEGIVKLSG